MLQGELVWSLKRTYGKGLWGRPQEERMRNTCEAGWPAANRGKMNQKVNVMGEKIKAGHRGTVAR